jgi:hypothetical protein
MTVYRLLTGRKSTRRRVSGTTRTPAKTVPAYHRPLGWEDDPALLAQWGRDREQTQRRAREREHKSARKRPDRHRAALSAVA